MADYTKLSFQSIGIIQSSYQDLEGMPIQPAGARGVSGKVILNPDLENGLMGLEGFSHILLIYYFHRSKGYKLQVKPFLDDAKQGVFATRAPCRPNSIGTSIVKLVKIEGNVLEIENLDILDGTPVLDIKPYVPDFNITEEVRVGWLENKLDNISNIRSDDRFQKD